MGLGDGEAAGPPPPPGVYTCDGRMLRLIVGCITLSSPLLVLLTQVCATKHVCPLLPQKGCWLVPLLLRLAFAAETACSQMPLACSGLASTQPHCYMY